MIKKLNKISEEKIITVIFLFIIFSMLIVTLIKNYDEIHKQISDILQNSEKTKYEKILELTKTSDNIINDNIILKSQYIDIYGLIQKTIQKNYIQDSNDRTRDLYRKKKI